jgi:cation diffusion facilitator CzcD-associated flavoprotein CzcO
VTPTPGLAEHAVAIVGAGTRGRSVQSALQAVGVTDVAVIDKKSGPSGEVVRSVFDDSTAIWTLHRADGAVLSAHIVIAAHRPAFVPWAPHLAGCNDFQGESFHAAAWDANFHPAGKNIAVVGTDSFAGHRVGRLVQSAKSVVVFPYAPRRVVTDMEMWPTRAQRWLRRRVRPTPPGPVVGSPIREITATGIRTVDGVEHPVDTIIYGTGFTIREDQSLFGAGGLTLRHAWEDGMEPFFGVAVHGFPNYFFLSGPDTCAQARYIADCVALRKRSGSDRIEVRRSSQQVFNERAQLTTNPPPPITSAFELSSSAPDYEDTYDGAATLEIGGTSHPVRVRLIGRLDPLDGNYHWQGTILDALPADSLKRTRAATLSVGQRSAPARIVEQTPWGTHSVAGVGAPPYAASDR